jgi:hypothetical protein
MQLLQQLQALNALQRFKDAYLNTMKVTDFPAALPLRLQAYFPPQLVTLRRVQWALPHAQHSFLMAESADALFVAFMGTKRPRDMATNVNVWQDQILFDAAASGDAADAGGGAGGAGATPAAHRGFSARAKAIPIEALYHQARARGKRLVLCGERLMPFFVASLLFIAACYCAAVTFQRWQCVRRASVANKETEPLLGAMPAP